ncbi:MAG: lytic transglycosylase domain-containing protein [Lentisphaerota bacterium]
MFFWKTLGLFLKLCIIAIVSIVICISVAIALYINWLTIKNKSYDSIILAAAARYNMDPSLIKAVIWKESSFNSFITGIKQERGLMQIMEKNAVQDWANYRNCDIPPIGVLYSPETNIDIGAWYLSRCRTHWVKYKDSLALTLAEYNAGYKNAKEWAPSASDGDVIERIKFPSTKNYVKAILSKYESYKSSETNFRNK